MTNGVLVIGYGNALRTDDGLGRHAAERLADDPRLAGATVIGCHQLTPELALDVSRAALVVFVDASHGLPAGAVTIEPMERTGRSATGWSHHFSPSSLVDLAGELYGRSPDVLLVSVGVESLQLGDRLSPVVEAALPRLVEAVAELVAARSVERGTVPVADHGRA
jgi:hydrogenase maturation protease